MKRPVHAAKWMHERDGCERTKIRKWSLRPCTCIRTGEMAMLWELATRKMLGEQRWWNGIQKPYNYMYVHGCTLWRLAHRLKSTCTCTHTLSLFPPPSLSLSLSHTHTHTHTHTSTVSHVYLDAHICLFMVHCYLSCICFPNCPRLLSLTNLSVCSLSLWFSYLIGIIFPWAPQQCGDCNTCT